MCLNRKARRCSISGPDLAVVLVVALACLALAPTSVSAAPPFTIHRSTDPALARNASPVGVVSQSPFDDVAGLLDDGVNYFYSVTDANDQPVSASFHKNLVLRTLRLSFDDGNPLAAPVDPFLSTVVASPDTIPADGVSIIRVTIVPHDVSGVPLGSGLSMSLDEGALWPGSLTEPISDKGNGTYVAQVASSIPGAGTVWVTVEGVHLNAEPSITYTLAGPPLSARESAIVRLEDLTKNGGRFDQLVEGLNPGADPGADKVTQALSDALDALSALYSGADVSALANFLKGSIADLVAALGAPGDVSVPGIESLIDDLLDIARLVAQHHLNEAEGTCGPCGQGGPAEVCDARAAFDAADAERQAASSPDYEAAANQYATAVDKAMNAVTSCQ